MNDQMYYVPISVITAVPQDDGHYALLKERYWEIVNGCVLFFKGYSPQCNSNKSIVDRNGKREVLFISNAWIPLDYNGVYVVSKIKTELGE